MENDELKNTKKEKLLESDYEDEEFNYNKINSPFSKKKPIFNYDAYLESGFFSKMLFLWAFKILKLGFKTELSNEDLGLSSKENDSQYYFKKINYVWEDLKYKEIKSNALLKTLLKVNLKYIIIVFILCLLDGFNEYIEIILLKSYIDWFEQNYTFFNIQNLKLLGFLFLFFKFNSIIVYLHYMMKQEAIGIWSSYQLDTFVYHKLLKVSPSSFIQRATHGEIINFTQVDSEKILWMIEECPQLIVAPFKIISFIYLLFKYFGLSFLAGFVMLILMFVINIYIYKGYMIIEEEMLEKKDDRMKITTETFDNIKLLKMYNWENEFKNKILEKRNIEIATGRKALRLAMYNSFFFWLCPILVAVSTIGVYNYYHDSLNISTVIIGLSIFNRLQEPLNQLPESISCLIDASISLRRIEKFIRQPEINEKNVIRGKYDEKGEFAIKIKNGSFTWGIKQKSEEELREEEEDEEEEENEIKVKEKEKKEEIKKIKEKIKNLKEQNKQIDIIELSNIESNNNNIQYENINTNLNINTLIPINKDLEQNPQITKDGVNIQIEIPEDVNFDVTLKNINFEVKPGEIIGIIGEVGSGKSSLLNAILNSLILLNPKECDGIHINGKIGYVAQNVWIQNATLKDNVLFFKKYNEKKYKECLEVSQLYYDLNNFVGKDLTEIGEKGVNLSGGQKVRISLARVLYNEPDIYLFDDPISALDANVGKKIMKDCIINYLKGKTRIIVTHAIQYLKYMDRIYYLKKGKIIFTGTYDELVNQNFFKDLKKLKRRSSKNINELEEEIINLEDEEKLDEMLLSNKFLNKLIQEEENEEGSVKLEVYIKYCKYMGGISFIILIIISMIIWQLNKGGSDLWLAYWTKNQDKFNKNSYKKWEFFGVYTFLGFMSIVFVLIRLCILIRGTLKLAKNLHKDMIDKLIKAPVNLFHETIPRGQILNRLSKDLEEINYTMFDIGNFLVGLCSCIGALILCSIYDSYSLIYAPILFTYGYILLKFYIVGSRSLTRLEAISHSPVLNTIGETIPGTVSIRAFEKEGNYLKKFYIQNNVQIKINIFIQGCYNWYKEQFDLISFFYFCYLVISTIIYTERFNEQAVGIMFSYSVLLQEYLAWTFSLTSQIENKMVSMERGLHYTKIIQELPSVLPHDNELKKKGWPNEGKIKFENYSVRYRPDTEIVLEDLNFEIMPLQKIGVVGRTGSGKSTICLCLFRILEPLKGHIYIDNEDITKIGLDLLRSNITIIPQDPCLFEGTLRYNIDPFKKYNDSEIINILKEIGFEYNEPDDEILDKMIEQNGTNLSVGEKQLICIARAMIRKTKIIVMDEATANIDMATEEKIQKALDIVFKNSTVITVAHRIKTIINYDKILVLEKGNVMEFDTPENLLKDTNSLFSKLYSKSTL